MKLEIYLKGGGVVHLKDLESFRVAKNVDGAVTAVEWVASKGAKRTLLRLDVDEVAAVVTEE